MNLLLQMWLYVTAVLAALLLTVMTAQAVVRGARAALVLVTGSAPAPAETQPASAPAAA
jgi:hypothetical protein